MTVGPQVVSMVGPLATNCVGIGGSKLLPMYIYIYTHHGPFLKGGKHATKRNQNNLTNLKFRKLAHRPRRIIDFTCFQPSDDCQFYKTILKTTLGWLFNDQTSFVYNLLTMLSHINGLNAAEHISTKSWVVPK